MTPALALFLLGFFAACAFACFLGWDLGEQARDNDLYNDWAAERRAKIKAKIARLERATGYHA